MGFVFKYNFIPFALENATENQVVWETSTNAQSILPGVE